MKNTFAFCLLFIALLLNANSQNSWQSKMNMSITGLNYPTGFSIGSFGYVTNRNTVNGDNLWEWSQATNTWTQKAVCPWIGGVGGAIAFSIGTKGYIGLGNNGGNFYNDFWEYDQSTNTWAVKNNFPGTNRTFATGFSIGAFGYVCLGQYSLNTPYYTNDLWEYNPTSDSWTQRMSFPGSARYQAVSFVVNSEAFVGLGSDVSTPPQDFYKYNPGTNQWSPIQNFPASGRINAIAFGLGNYGYAGLGSYGPPFATLYEYNSLTDQWIAAASLPDSARSRSAYFSINGRGYSAAGLTSVGFSNDLWEYIPGWMTAIETEVIPNEVSISLSLNFLVIETERPINSINIYNTGGALLYSGVQNKIPRSMLAKGINLVQIRYSGVENVSRSIRLVQEKTPSPLTKAYFKTVFTSMRLNKDMHCSKKIKLLL